MKLFRRTLKRPALRTDGPRCGVCGGPGRVYYWRRANPRGLTCRDCGGSGVEQGDNHDPKRCGKRVRHPNFACTCGVRETAVAADRQEGLHQPGDSIHA